MSVVALIFVPLVLLYQGWSYYVFRHRVGDEPLAPEWQPGHRDGSTESDAARLGLASPVGIPEPR